MTRYGFLGPVGTFTQAALAGWPAAEGREQTAFSSVDKALAALREGEIDAAMVPIENSVEGGVSATLDALHTGDPLTVVGEVLVPITFVLAVRPGTTRDDVRAVGTHPHGWAQVRGWMGSELPDAVYVPTLSTAAAAADLAAGLVDSYQAAVCAPVAAQGTGLQVLASDIEDRTGAVTRFVLAARPGELPEPTGADKTTVVVYQYDDHAGGLLELLEQFAARGINISRLESRPTGDVMGRYCFSIDFEGHVRDARVGEALTGLRRVAADVRFLGSYPRADGQQASIQLTATDDAFADADRWLANLRGERAH
ncbi:prephenate dehydratase [Allobranchiibius sp. GilTou73]|uniref:prephenate dehydratase n=1 Tax=Allobranchiibius sp. GilTou73 TaxID=2904523 RepID=UPI001F3A5A51|nr:prephenate dehydratase [Allobranchiibius sp. GilTou73]UIJ35355.1 prephenate dehydratase [Allobranchiibius sp. GilTou73]